VISLNGHSPKRTIAVDAMGGDHAPEEIVKGAVEAHRQGVDVVLVGRIDEVRHHLSALRADLPVVDATDVIGMDEPVTSGLRRRRSSLQVAAELASSGEADGVVSCGNSAAIYFVAFSEWGTYPGIDRPAFGALLPCRNGQVLVLDVGANTIVKSSNLLQFAIMGEVYMKLAHGIATPRIALLSNGSEDSKGTKEIKEANEALRRLSVNFVGNIEGNHVFEGQADVVVCDGFSGNVLLKSGEGVVHEIFREMRKELSRDPLSKLAAAALRPAFVRLKRRLDYEEYGGAPVLGVDGVMINCHGRSKARAVTNAICLADRMVQQNLVERIGDALHHEGTETHHRRIRLRRALHLRASEV